MTRNGSASFTAPPLAVRLGDLTASRGSTQPVAADTGGDQFRQVVGAVWGADQVVRGRGRPDSAPVTERAPREQDRPVPQVGRVVVVQGLRGTVVPASAPAVAPAVHDPPHADPSRHVSHRSDVFFPATAQECQSAGIAAISAGEFFLAGPADWHSWAAAGKNADPPKSPTVLAYGYASARSSSGCQPTSSIAA